MTLRCEVRDHRAAASTTSVQTCPLHASSFGRWCDVPTCERRVIQWLRFAVTVATADNHPAALSVPAFLAPRSEQRLHWLDQQDWCFAPLRLRLTDLAVHERSGHVQPALACFVFDIFPPSAAHFT